MAATFFTLFRDIAKLAASAADDLAHQSSKMIAAADDVASMTGHAAVKTAGVAGDDLAVGAGQVSGVSPSRELPALWRIVKGSALNKIWLSVVLLVVSFYMPMLVTVALICGAIFLAYEGGHGLMEIYYGKDEVEEVIATEDEKVRAAVKTDMILSLEMLVIALSSTGDASIEYKIAVLAGIGFIMTVGVYGIIGLIIRLDDMGIHLAKDAQGAKKKIGEVMVNAAPKILKVLGPIGMVAMFAVAGGIFTHLAHVEYPHWAAGLLADSIIGMIAGLIIYNTIFFIKRIHQNGIYQ